MFIADLSPSVNKRILFSLSALWKAPEESGCYVLTNVEDEILYIGQANNIHERVKQHLHKRDKSVRTPLGVAFWLYYKLFDRKDLNALETGWCNNHKMSEKGELPFFNKINPPA